MAYFSVAQCEAMLAQLLARLHTTVDGAKYTMDAAGQVLQEHDLAAIEAQIAAWEERLETAKAAALPSAGSAIKLIGRRPV